MRIDSTKLRWTKERIAAATVKGTEFSVVTMDGCTKIVPG